MFLFGQTDPLKDSINFYSKLGNYNKAKFFSLELEKKFNNDNDRNSLPHLAIKEQIGKLEFFLGNYQNAIVVFDDILQVDRKKFGGESKEVAKALYFLGTCYKNLGDFNKSEELYLESLAIRKKVLGEKHPDFIVSIQNLGLLYLGTGDEAKAKFYILKSIELNKSINGDSSLELGKAYNNLGIYSNRIGNIHLAQQSFDRSNKIFKIHMGPNHPLVGTGLINLGVTYMTEGNYLLAEKCFLEQIELISNALGSNSYELRYGFNNLGALYFYQREFQKSKIYYQKSLSIMRQYLKPDNPDYLLNLQSLSNIEIETFNLYAAEILYDTLNFYYKDGDSDFRDVLGSKISYAVLLFYQGRIDKAEIVLTDLYKEYKDRMNNGNQNLSTLCGYLAYCHFSKGELDKSDFYSGINKKNYLEFIKSNFKNISSSSRENIFDRAYKSFEAFSSLRLSKKEVRAEDLKEVYNNQLSTKGTLCNQFALMKHRIRNSKDTNILVKFENWENKQNLIGKLVSRTDSSGLAEFKKLTQEAEILETQLSNLTENFSKISENRAYKWTDIQKKLKPGEAAIEMVRVRKYGINTIITDTSDPKKTTYKIKGLSDTAYYAALIVKPTSKYPELVLLKNGNELEGKWLQGYKNSIRAKLNDQNSYKQFWQKIDAKLGLFVKRVYFSPDGVYNSINLNTLQNPKTGKYLLDERDIRLVTNTKDILTASISKPSPDYACVVGFPDYNTGKEKRAAVFQKDRNHPAAWYNLDHARSDAFVELPATKTEVENIAGLMQSNGWQVESLLGENALEESIKALQKPRVLHIATHGFFQPDTTKGSNPLIHSGLLLTGANKTLSGEKDDKVDDGILTAYEAMNLNLDNTDLVVLSACETGLGEIKNGEGVYGLQRAFKVAGAKSIIMSLWKVSDQATQELMVSFYKNWLGSASENTRLSGRMNKRSAFLKAQKELKAKYQNPYYWGAFVIVGE